MDTIDFDEEYADEQYADQEEDDSFRKGYNEEEKVLECAECGTAIKEGKKVSRTLDEEEHAFCSKDCADEFEESMGGE